LRRCKIFNNCSDNRKKRNKDDPQNNEGEMGSDISDIPEKKSSEGKQVNPENIPDDAERNKS
jgi:hypothetical protein